MPIWGERLSATWRSLLAARPYVEHGLMRRIGNGDSTHIWGESWLQSQDSGRIITRRPFDSAHPDRVSDLIDGEQGTWGEGLIRQVFWETDARVYSRRHLDQIRHRINMCGLGQSMKILRCGLAIIIL